MSSTNLRKRRAAKLSICSNAVLIALKLVAGALTGSVAIISEAVHSSIDLVASFIAFFSIRTASQPADERHPYGHGKFEHLAAAIEAILILVGSGVIIYEASRRLATHAEVQQIGIGITIIALSIAVNVVVAFYLKHVARQTTSPALEGDAAHLQSDAVTSVGVLGGLIAVQMTGAVWLDSLAALLVAVIIVSTGTRLLWKSSRALVDESLPEEDLVTIRQTIKRFAGEGVVGYHKLRGRQVGAWRHVDLHAQFRVGMTLETAHTIAHKMQDEIAVALADGETEVLIHIEPADRVRPGTELEATEASVDDQ